MLVGLICGVGVDICQEVGYVDLFGGGGVGSGKSYDDAVVDIKYLWVVVELVGYFCHEFEVAEGFLEIIEDECALETTFSLLKMLWKGLIGDGSAFIGGENVADIIESGSLQRRCHNLSLYKPAS